MKKTILFSAVLLLFPFFAKADSYDFYVNKNYEGQESGTQWQPYRTISQAIERSKQNMPGLRRIFISDGEYSEELTLSESIKLFGQSQQGTVLKVSPLSTINLSDQNTLQHLTISGGMAALTIQGSAFIQDCLISDAKKKGLDILPGEDLVVIKNSSITSNGGKGIYVQRGRKILVSDNLIKENRGEGLDIRQSVSGLVINNEISNNEESGIEALAGASDLMIKKNIIKNNRANGIATQSYPEVLENGKLKIFENILSQNGKYGFYCGAPSGGKHARTYFSESILLSTNENRLNLGKPVSSSCHFERQTQQYINDITTNIENETTELSELYANFQILQQQIDEDIVSSKQITKEIALSGIFKKIFRGTSEDELNSLKISKDKLIGDTETLSAFAQNSSEDKISNALEAVKSQLAEEIEGQDVFIRKSIQYNKIFWLPIKIASIF